MDYCKFCRELLHGEREYHAECLVELHHRVAAKKCSWCGRRRHLKDSHWCAKCRDDKNRQYLGFVRL